MKNYELIGEIGENRRLHVQLPPDFPPGKVRVRLVFLDANDVDADAETPRRIEMQITYLDLTDAQREMTDESIYRRRSVDCTRQLA